MTTPVTKRRVKPRTPGEARNALSTYLSQPGRTQTKLGELVRVSQEYISMITRGRRPSGEVAKRLERVTDIPQGAWFDGSS